MSHEKGVSILLERGRRKTALILLLSIIIVLLGASRYFQKTTENRTPSQRTSNVLNYYHASPSGWDRPSSYAEVWKRFYIFTPYIDSNLTIADAHWNAFDNDRGWVKLSHSWAARQDISPGLELPDDVESGLFILDAYHQMHCLMSIRSAMYAMFHGEEMPSPEIHWRHCLDFLRQAILCRVDDTPLPTGHMDGSARLCRSWGKLEEWASEHDTCWKMVHNRWTRKETCN